jgi:hypothetical protein
MVLGSPTGAQCTVKNESHLCTKKNTLFYSKFDADSEYVSLFENYFGQKNGLIDTCPLTSASISGMVLNYLMDPLLNFYSLSNFSTNC